MVGFRAQVPEPMYLTIPYCTSSRYLHLYCTLLYLTVPYCITLLYLSVGRYLTVSGVLVMVVAVWSAVTNGVGMKYQVLPTYTYLLAINTTKVFISFLLILLLFTDYCLLLIIIHYASYRHHSTYRERIAECIFNAKG